jgi:hypothetical protein
MWEGVVGNRKESRMMIGRADMKLTLFRAKRSLILNDSLHFLLASRVSFYFTTFRLDS